MEINPFHNGHKYFLDSINKKEDDILIVIISTSITQRGEISVLPKDIKTKILLDNNVDIVVELPSVFANQGGLYFAKHSINILKKLDITDLYFGSESNDIDSLLQIVNNDITQKDFKNGIYKQELSNLKSNDILGISYLKAIKDTNITPHLIKRINNSYNEINITGRISSATSIRQNISNKELIKDSLPSISMDSILNINEKALYILFINNLSYCIDENINIFLSEDMQLLFKLHKIYLKHKPNTIDQLINLSCDKNNSKHKLRRIITNTVLLVVKKDYTYDYLRVLGFNQKGIKYLKNYKGMYITSLKNNTSNNAIIESRATQLQNMLAGSMVSDYSKPLIKENK